MHEMNNITFRAAEARIATAIAAAANSTRRALGGAFGENFRNDLRCLDVDGFTDTTLDPSAFPTKVLPDVLLAAPAAQGKLGQAAASRQVI